MFLGKKGRALALGSAALFIAAASLAGCAGLEGSDDPFASSAVANPAAAQYTGSANTVGNTPGNLANFGREAIQGDRIYYTCLTDVSGNVASLCKIKTDGTDRQKISENVYSVSVADGWIYYRNVIHDSAAHRIKVDGTHERRLRTDALVSLVAENGWLYYYGDSGGTGIKAVRADGAGGRSVAAAERIGAFIVAGDPLVYSDPSDDAAGGLYIVHTDGGGQQKLSDDGTTSCINIVGDWI